MTTTIDKLYKNYPLYRELFHQQLLVALAPNRFVAAICSRRAGKTTVVAVKALQELLNYPNSIGYYLALTDKSVESILMPIIRPLVMKYKIPCKINSDEVIFDNGSKLLIGGANHINKIESFRGLKLRFCIIDEAASFRDEILDYLIDEIIGPALSDLQGQLMLVGTPASHCSGMFYDVTTKNEGNSWSVHRWTSLDNPFMAEVALKERQHFLNRKQCDESNPKYRREYLGEWCQDSDSKLVKHFQLVDKPIYVKDDWRTVIGIDFGFNDKTVISVIGWRYNNPIAYVLETVGLQYAGTSKIAAELQRVKQQYNPISVVGDPAGSSKIIMQEFSEKYKIHMESAQKTNKAHYVEVLDDALLNNNLLICKENVELIAELKSLVWNEERTREREGQPCDYFDSVLYAFRAARAYLEKVPIPVKPKTPEDIAREMEQQLVEQYKKKHDDGSTDAIFQTIYDDFSFGD